MVEAREFQTVGAANRKALCRLVSVLCICGINLINVTTHFYICLPHNKTTGIFSVKKDASAFLAKCLPISTIIWPVCL